MDKKEQKLKKIYDERERLFRKIDVARARIDELNRQRQNIIMTQEE